MAMSEDLRGRSPKDALEQEIEQAFRGMFDTVLSSAELLITGDAYAKFRSRVLGKGNSELRRLKALLAQEFTVQWAGVQIVFGAPDAEE